MSSKCKVPEVGKKLVHMKTRKKAAVATTHERRRVSYEMRLDR